MIYSTQSAVSDGSLVNLALTIDYFDRSEISVYFDDIVTPPGVWNWVGVSDAAISFSPAVAAGVTVGVKRTTSIDAPRHVFEDGAQFKAQTLDENAEQLLRVAQEVREGAGISEVYNDLNLHGYAIRNVADAVDPGDPVTLRQYQVDTAGAYEALQLARELIDLDGSVVLQSELPSRYGRADAADLPRFMDAVRAYRTDTRPTLNILGFGSSVGLGASLITPLVDAPVAWFTSRLKARLDPNNLLNIVVNNLSVNGSAISEFPTAWASRTALGTLNPGIAVLAYGMNDQAPALYNSGQTYDGFYKSYRAAIDTLKDAGWDVVILTTPHPSLVLNPGYHAMPNSVPQIYPTYIAAPVGPEAMSPPASASTLTGDYTGGGVEISVGFRALRINQSMRALAREFGCTLIDVERYWFEALQKYKLQTGSMAGAEAMLFNTGESVHPNLHGHQVSYQRAINDFVNALVSQTSQSNAEPRLNGMFAVNGGGVTPGAVFDVYQRYPNMTSPALRLWQRIGTPDANTVKAHVEVLRTDPANGDLVLCNGAYRFKSNLSPSGSSSNRTDTYRTSYGVAYHECVCGEINNSTSWSIAAFDDNSSGELMVSGQQGGVGTSPQTAWYRWYTKAGVTTLALNGASVGSLVFNVDVIGLNVIVTPVAANTNFQAVWKAINP